MPPHEITPARRHNMSRIRSKNTRPELQVRQFLHAHGYRFRIHDKRLPGSPDIVLPKYQTLIFVHGCFWHGHQPCKYFKMPTTRTEFWKAKIDRNQQRDAEVQKQLQRMGWRILLLWECDLKQANWRGRLLRELRGEWE